MLYLTIALFALAALLGLWILKHWLAGQGAPRGVVYAHGLVAAAGLGLLAYFALRNPTHYPQISLLLFVVAALGGFYLLFRDLRGQNSPMAIAGLHAVLAVGGFLSLLLFVFG